MEYPRPQFMREDWVNLNGNWQFAFDDETIGKERKWYLKDPEFPLEIQVPFAYQSEFSGIHDTKFHDVVWYKKEIANISRHNNKEVILHFGAVDYRSEVYVNGSYVGGHEGGHTPFSLTITNFLNFENDVLAVRVEDPSEDETIPRGKQFWKEESESIWYTRTTGIWQTVWLEFLDTAALQSVKYHTSVTKAEVIMDFETTAQSLGKELEVSISFNQMEIVNDRILIKDKEFSRGFKLYKNKILAHNFHGEKNSWDWTPENPSLFETTFKIIDTNSQKCCDKVISYFGLREIHVENGKVYLNNRPYYQKLVLDQGYWPEGLMTAPSDDSFIEDIKLAKEMGFNGCRKHQKVEDPRFLYWADKLGFLVWGECASVPSFDDKAVKRIANEWFEIIDRDYNHPSIVTWVPLNESWGIPDICCDAKQQAHSLALYYQIHSLDHSRLVISNDGWEMTKTDICAIHNYAHGINAEDKKYEQFKQDLYSKDSILASTPSNRKVYVNGYSYEGVPILLTEFGGIGFKTGDQSGWGYTSAKDSDDFLREYTRVLEAVYHSKVLNGYCYTQLTDIEQEINGLLTYDRVPKCDLKAIKAINDAH